MRNIFTMLRSYDIWYWPLFLSLPRGHFFPRYFIAGSVAFIVQYTIFYILLQWFGDGLYLLSSSIGLGFGIVTSFFLQKFWTFKDSCLKRMPKQIVFFVFVATTSVLFNALLMAILVTFLQRIIVAQTIAMIILALASFLFHHKITFNNGEKSENNNNNRSVSS